MSMTGIVSFISGISGSELACRARNPSSGPSGHTSKLSGRRGGSSIEPPHLLQLDLTLVVVGIVLDRALAVGIGLFGHLGRVPAAILVEDEDLCPRLALVDRLAGPVDRPGHRLVHADDHIIALALDAGNAILARFAGVARRRRPPCVLMIDEQAPAWLTAGGLPGGRRRGGGRCLASRRRRCRRCCRWR